LQATEDLIKIQISETVCFFVFLVQKITECQIQRLIIGFFGIPLAIDLRKVNNSFFMWGENNTLRFSSVGWNNAPSADGNCGAYSSGSVVLKDCQSVTRVLCMDE
jgi:hypothetical protein